MKSFNFLLLFFFFRRRCHNRNISRLARKAERRKMFRADGVRCFQLKLAYRLCCLNNFAFDDDVMKAETEEKSLKSFACLLFRNFHHATSSTLALRRRK